MNTPKDANGNELVRDGLYTTCSDSGVYKLTDLTLDNAGQVQLRCTGKRTGGAYYRPEQLTPADPPQEEVMVNVYRVTIDNRACGMYETCDVGSACDKFNKLHPESYALVSTIPLSRLIGEVKDSD